MKEVQHGSTNLTVLEYANPASEIRINNLSVVLEVLFNEIDHIMQEYDVWCHKSKVSR